MKIISASINLSNIDKGKIIEGKKGKYLNITIIENDEPDQYGNHVSIQQQQTKEEREAKQPKNYLGNGKIVHVSNKTSQQSVKSDENDFPY